MSVHKKSNAVVYKRYSDAMKLMVVRRINRGETKNHVAKELGIPESTIRRWINREEEYELRIEFQKQSTCFSNPGESPECVPPSPDNNLEVNTATEDSDGEYQQLNNEDCSSSSGETLANSITTVTTDNIVHTKRKRLRTEKYKKATQKILIGNLSLRELYEQNKIAIPSTARYNNVTKVRGDSTTSKRLKLSQYGITSTSTRGLSSSSTPLFSSDIQVDNAIIIQPLESSVSTKGNTEVNTEKTYTARIMTQPSSSIDTSNQSVLALDVSIPIVRSDPKSIITASSQTIDSPSSIISRAVYPKSVSDIGKSVPQTDEDKPRIFIKCTNALLATTAPKDAVGPGEVSWPVANSSSPGPSRKSGDSRPSTSTAPSSYIKPDPGTPPPMIMTPLNPYIQEPQLAPQLGPRLLPKPVVQQPPQQQQQQMRLRMRPIAPAPPPPPQIPEPDSEPQQVCLRWNSFHSNMQTMFPSLLTREKFVDVTLACEGRSIKCHKVVLSSCSAYLERLLSENPCKHPIILMPRDLRFWELRALVDFMYRGEVNVEHEQLPSLLAAAEALQVKGLAGPASSLPPDPPDDPPDPPSSPRAKRKRVSSPPPVQHAPPPRPPQQQQQKTPQLPNSPSVSITRLVPRSAAASTSQHQPPVTLPSSSQESQNRVHSPGIEITPVVSFEEIKVEPIDISDSNDESMDPMDTNQDYDMDAMDKDYADDEIEDREDMAGGEEEEPPDPSTEAPNSEPQSLNGNGTHDSTDNETEAVESTPDFEGNGVDFDDATPDLDSSNYASVELGLRTEPPDIENPPPDDTS